MFKTGLGYELRHLRFEFRVIVRGYIFIFFRCFCHGRVYIEDVSRQFIFEEFTAKLKNYAQSLK